MKYLSIIFTLLMVRSDAIPKECNCFKVMYINTFYPNNTSTGWVEKNREKYSNDCKDNGKEIDGYTFNDFNNVQYKQKFKIDCK